MSVKCECPGQGSALAVTACVFMVFKAGSSLCPWLRHLPVGEELHGSGGSTGPARSIPVLENKLVRPVAGSWEAAVSLIEALGRA